MGERRTAIAVSEEGDAPSYTPFLHILGDGHLGRGAVACTGGVDVMALVRWRRCVALVRGVDRHGVGARTGKAVGGARRGTCKGTPEARRSGSVAAHTHARTRLFRLGAAELIALPRVRRWLARWGRQGQDEMCVGCVAERSKDSE